MWCNVCIPFGFLAKPSRIIDFMTLSASGQVSAVKLKGGNELLGDDHGRRVGADGIVLVAQLHLGDAGDACDGALADLRHQRRLAHRTLHRAHGGLFPGWGEERKRV